MQRVTLKSVAEKCGVSLQTVSKILNGNKAHLYKEETRKLIRDTAKELGYKPNTQAQAMKLGRFKTVMLLRSQDASYSHLSTQVVMAIQNKLEEYGYKLMITVLPRDVANEEDLPRFFHENYVDGVIISINRNLPPHLGDVLDSLNIPKVWIGGEDGPDTVRHNDYQSAYDITEKLIGLGHKKIVYADITAAVESKNDWHFSVTERMEGYKKAMSDSNIESVTVIPKKTVDEKEAVAFSEKHILDTHSPTAIIAYGLWKTGRAIMYTCAKRGIEIPEELSLVLWSDEQVVENDIIVSSYISASDEIGARAAELIYGRMEKNSEEKGPFVIPFTFNEGETLTSPK